MKREFNLTGVCVSNMHYIADTSEQTNEIFENLIEPGKYFSILGGRQFGKTTTINLLTKIIDKQDDYLLIKTSFEAIGDIIYENEKTFSTGFLEILYYDTKFKDKKLAEEFKTASKTMIDYKTLSDFITDFSENKKRKIVLIIDEVDKSLNNQIFLSFLGLLRDKYIKRNQSEDYSFHSVILAGVHDIKTLKIKIREGDEEKLNSPWNIAANFDVDLSFRPPQIVTLIDDYLTEHTGVKVLQKKEISEKIYFYTNGYPFLVSLMCKMIAEKIITKRETQNWTLEDVKTAFEMIVNSAFTTTLFDSIAKNLINNQKLYKFIYEIIVNNKNKPFVINNPNVLLAKTHGIIKNDNGCKMHNPIFEQRIYDLMLSIRLDNSTEKVLYSSDEYYKGNDIDIEFILLRFQKFFKENFSHDNQQFLEKEARLVFLSYLIPIINSKGYIFKEPVVGDNRKMDLVFTYNNKRYVVELKIWRGEKYHQKAIRQLSDYLDIYSLKKGTLLIFNFNKNKKFKKEIIKYKDKEIFTVWT